MNLINYFYFWQINNKERVPVECILHHWSTKIANRLPRTNFFLKDPVSIFPEQAELLKSLRQAKK